MFTGIIQQVGFIKEIAKNADKTRISISSEGLNNLKPGDSICIDGICSTATAISGLVFAVEFMPETLKRTTADIWVKGRKLNIEHPLRLSDKLNGHFVLGHIDATGEILKIKHGKETKEFNISYPENLSKFIALKGSIAIDGASLTISHLTDSYFTVSLIPYTLENTTFGGKKEKDRVNIEIDMISRYLKRLFDKRDKQTSYEFLKERGFI